MEKVDFVSAQQVKIEFELATVFQRGIAYVLDTLISYVYVILVMILILSNFSYSDADNVLGIFTFLITLPIVLYKPLMEYFF